MDMQSWKRISMFNVCVMSRMYITTRHHPIFDDYVLGVPAIEAVGIDGAPLRAGGGVHVEIGHCDILAVCNKGVPVTYACP